MCINSACLKSLNLWEDGRQRTAFFVYISLELLLVLM